MDKPDEAGGRARPVRQQPCPFRPSAELVEELCGVVFEQARFPMTVLDGSFRFVRVNESFASLLDWSDSELLGRPVTDITHADDVVAGQSAARDVADGHGPQAFEKRYLRRDGKAVRVEILVDLLRDAAGEPTCYLSQMRDVTEERAADERLRRLVRLHAALASTNEAVLHSATPEQLFESACRIAVEHGGFRLAWIGKVRPEDQAIVPIAVEGPGSAYVAGIRLSAAEGPGGQGPSGRAIRTLRPEVSDVWDASMAPWKEAALAAGFATCAAFPLFIDGSALGVLNVYAAELGYFDDEVIALIERLVMNVSYGWQAFEHDEERRRSQVGFEEQTRRLRQRFEQTSVPSLTVDLEGHITDANEAMCALVGRAMTDLVGSGAAELFEDEGAGLLPGLDRRRGPARNTPIEVVERRLRRGDGGVTWVIASGTLVRDAKAKGFEVYVQMQDITHRRRAEELAARRHAQQGALAELGRTALGDEPLEELFARAVDLVAHHATVEIVEILEVDHASGNLLRRATTGFRPDALAAAGSMVPGKRSIAGRALGSSAPIVVAELGEADGLVVSPLLKAHRVRSSAAVVVGSGGLGFGVLEVHSSTPRGFEEEEIPFLESVAHVVGAAIARRQAEAELARRALYDALTGLPNRALLFQRLEEALERSVDRGEVGLLFVDLDRFKVVNDSLGHGAGDELLQRCCERVVAAVREGDTVSRFGGDELVIVCEAIGGAEGAVELAGRVLEALEIPVRIAGHEITPSASIGVAAGTSGDRPSDLLRNADIAMYRAKESGGGCTVAFDDAMRASLEDRLELETDLRHALEREELIVYYQPVVDLASGLLVGAEALVRWRHPTRGIVEPAAFIPLAEETGLIFALGARVLSLVCADLARWSKEVAERHFVVSVNVSARQLRAPSFPGSVAAALAVHGLPGSALCLEITESILMEDNGTTLAVLDELKALGVRLSVDDFGTGYSSLAYLRRFPIDELKVDKSFVAELGGSKSQAAIVTGVVQLARALQLAVVAEGVETSAQLGHLRDLGCDRAQGFLVSTPVEGDEFEAHWLRLARS